MPKGTGSDCQKYNDLVIKSIVVQYTKTKQKVETVKCIMITLTFLICEFEDGGSSLSYYNSKAHSTPTEKKKKRVV